MGVKMLRVGKALPAVIAEEGLLARVRSLVAVAVHFLAERHVAVGAGVRLFTRVDSLVLFQSADGDEAFLADRAHVRLLVGVHALVLFKVRFVIETHVAVCALKRPLTGVYALMAFEVSFGLEAVAAQFTAERFVSAVRLHVDFEGGLRGVSFAAHAADVRPQQLLFIAILVHFHVSRQKRRRHQLLSTDTARRDGFYSTLLLFTISFL